MARHWILVAVLGAGLAVRLALVANTGAMPLQIVDERHYAQLATSLLQRNEFGFEPDRLTSMRPPVYPLFVASIWRVAGVGNLQAVRAGQIVVSLLVVAALYALTLRLFDRRAAAAAAAILCFYPSFLFSGLLLLTEVLFTLFVLLFVLQYSALVRTAGYVVAITAGATLGAAALTRSVLWPFPALFVPLLLATVRGSWTQRGAVVACCLTGYALVVGPWAVRNTRLQQTLTFVDTMGGMNLRMGNYEFTPEDRMWDAVSLTGEKNWSYGVGRAHPEAGTWTDGQKDKWAQGEAIAYMRAHPGTTMRRAVLKFADFWGLERELIAGIQQGLYHPPAWFAALAIVGVLVSYPLIAIGAVVGVFCTTPLDRRVHALVLALVLFITAIHVVVFGHSRYHLPLMPFLVMYAAAVLIERPWRALIANPVRMAAPAAACAVLLAAWGHEILFRDAERIRLLLSRFT